jgi:hypothetical protein
VSSGEKKEELDKYVRGSLTFTSSFVDRRRQRLQTKITIHTRTPLISLSMQRKAGYSFATSKQLSPWVATAYAYIFMLLRVMSIFDMLL